MYQTLKNSILLVASIAVLFLATGCTTPARIKMPGNQFRTPEVRGKFGSASITAEWLGAADVKVVDNINSPTPQATADIGENGAAGMSVDFGLLSFVDFYYSDREAFPDLFGLKIQLLGDSKRESGEGNFSVAIAGAMATGAFNTDKTDSELEIESSANNDYSGYEAVVSIGYRPERWVLWYLAPFYYSLSGTTTVDLTSAGVTTRTIETKGEGEHYGVALGVDLGIRYFTVKFEGSLASTKWTRTSPGERLTDTADEGYFGMSIGGGW